MAVDWNSTFLLPLRLLLLLLVYFWSIFVGEFGFCERRANEFAGVSLSVLVGLERAPISYLLATPSRAPRAPSNGPGEEGGKRRPETECSLLLPLLLVVTRARSSKQSHFSLAPPTPSLSLVPLARSSLMREMIRTIRQFRSCSPSSPFVQSFAAGEEN